MRCVCFVVWILKRFNNLVGSIRGSKSLQPVLSPAYVYVKARLSQWRRHHLVRGAQNYMKLVVAHKMTRYTLNKVHVAATEIPQLLSQNTNMFGQAPHKVSVRLCGAPKLTDKI